MNRLKRQLDKLLNTQVQSLNLSLVFQLFWAPQRNLGEIIELANVKYGLGIAAEQYNEIVIWYMTCWKISILIIM